MITDLKPDPSMKDSGVPWLGRVPEHWNMERAETAARVFLGPAAKGRLPAPLGAAAPSPGRQPWVSAPPHSPEPQRGGGRPARREILSSPKIRAFTTRRHAMANTYTNLLVHIVFGTKSRSSSISADLREDLYAYIGGIVRGEGGSLQAIGGMSDHVHLLVRVGPRISISDLLQSPRWCGTSPTKKSIIGRGPFAKSWSSFSIATVSKMTRGSCRGEPSVAPDGAL
jgi:REP element-mobilizing transposase RayT